MFGKALAGLSNGGFHASDISFDTGTGQLTDGARTRRLEPRAAAVLARLNEARGAVMSRQELLDRCWGIGQGSDEALTQAVAQIRRAFEELGSPGPIETLTKRGYRLTVPLGDQGIRTARRLRPIVLVAVILIVLLVLAYLKPHGVKHFIRHNFDFGFSGSDQPDRS